jgi:hypothetical protein
MVVISHGKERGLLECLFEKKLIIGKLICSRGRSSFGKQIHGKSRAFPPRFLKKGSQRAEKYPVVIQRRSRPVKDPSKPDA